MAHPLGDKTSVALGVMIVLLAIPYAHPALSRLRVVPAPWEAAAEGDDREESAPAAAPVPTEGETALAASENEGTITNALPDRPSSAAALATERGSLAIDDPTGRALDAFYARLAKTKRREPGAVTRILHYGDSVLTSDYVSGTMRRKLQAEFGDAGHGFILVAKPWSWYFHNDVRQGASEGWSSSRITGPFNNDRMYGVGGVSFAGSPGATSWFATSTGAYGARVSRFDVYYMETPGGGDIELRAAGRTERFSTRGPAKVSRVRSLAVPDGEARMALKVLSGKPRLFGVALERDVPGVVYDALGANGGRAELLEAIDGEHWKDQMALRDPALIVLHFGTNESEYGMQSRERYERTLRSLVDKAKAAAPNASVLVVAPLDRAEKNPKTGALQTRKVIERLVEAQKKVAAEAGVGFWNTFEAMGGEGSIASWLKRGLASSDLTHPTPEGAEALGELFYGALTSGFEAAEATPPPAD